MKNRSRNAIKWSIESSMEHRSRRARGAFVA